MENSAMLFTPIELCMTSENQTAVQSNKTNSCQDFVAMFIEQMKQQTAKSCDAKQTDGEGKGKLKQGKSKSGEDLNSLSMMASLALMNVIVPNSITDEKCSEEANLNFQTANSVLQMINQNTDVDLNGNLQQTTGAFEQILSLNSKGIAQSAFIMDGNSLQKEADLEFCLLSKAFEKGEAAVTSETKGFTDPLEILSAMRGVRLNGAVNPDVQEKLSGQSKGQGGSSTFSTIESLNVEKQQLGEIKPARSLFSQKDEKTEAVLKENTDLQTKQLVQSEKSDNGEAVEVNVRSREKIGEALKPYLQKAAQENKETVVMKLSPRELGDITVKISKAEGRVEIKLIPSMEDTARLLEGAQKDLAAAFKTGGSEVQISTVAAPSNGGMTDFLSGQGFMNRQEQRQSHSNYSYALKDDGKNQEEAQTSLLNLPGAALSMYA